VAECGIRGEKCSSILELNNSKTCRNVALPLRRNWKAICVPGCTLVINNKHTCSYVNKICKEMMPVSPHSHLHQKKIYDICCLNCGLYAQNRFVMINNCVLGSWEVADSIHCSKGSHPYDVIPLGEF